MKPTGVKPRSSPAFDWTMGCFSVLVMAGVYQDGWAHAHGLVDQSFFTPWHAILYGSMAIAGIFLAITGVRNMMRGYSFRDGLPAGYWTSAIGVVLFAIGGVFDLWWHTMFGIEVNIEGLVSPSHLILAIGGALLVSGPLISIAYQYPRSEGRWSRVGPALMSSLAALMLLGFFTQYAAPVMDDTMLAILGPNQTQPGAVVYSVRPDGTRETRILNVAGGDVYGATFPPDGKHFAYRKQVPGDSWLPSDIYVARADGSQSVRITHSGRHDTQTAWSPDGKRIAFISMPAGTSGDFMLQTIRPDGSDLQTIVRGVTTLQSPAWSPDSRWIAYTSRNGLTDEVAIVSARGGAARWLTSTAGGGSAAWSKSGAIAFEDKDGNISATTPDDASAHVIVRGASSPAWSNDGAHLAFLRNAGGETQVFYSNADGSGVRNVSSLAGLSATGASVSPGGDIVFTARGHASPLQTGIGRTYAIDAAIVSSILLMGVLLLNVRRYRVPAGGITLILGGYALAAATQNDLYFLLPAAFATSIAADAYLAILKDNARQGRPFYIFAFAVPALIFALDQYLVGVHVSGLGWSPNMIMGAPLIAGICGLLVSFCFNPPLGVGTEAVNSAGPA